MDVAKHWKLILVATVAAGLVAGAVYYSGSPQKKTAESQPASPESSPATKKKSKKSKKKASAMAESVVAEAGVAVEQVAGLPEKTPVAKTRANPEELNPQERAALAQEAKSLGNKLYSDKKFKEAIEMYSRAISLAPAAVFYSNRAACYANIQDSENVLSDCNEALKLDPKYIKALHRRAQAFESLNRPQEALNDYTVICVLEGFKNEGSMAAPDRLLKEIASEKTIEIMKGKDIKMPSETFIAAYMDSFRALPSDAQIISTVESDAESTMLLKSAFESVAKRSWQQAFDFCDQSITVGKFSDEIAESKALNLRGTFHFLMGRVEDAILDIEKSLELDGENINTIIKRATLFMERGDVQKTNLQFERAETLSPNHVDLFYHRGQVRFLTGDFQGAVDDYTKSVESEAEGEQSVYVHIQMGVAKYKLGDIGGAERKFKEAKRLFPDNAEVFNYHGEILLDKQSWEEGTLI